MAQNTHFKLVSLHKSPTGICNKFQNKMDGQSQQLHSISLVRKSILFKTDSSPHWPQFFLKCGSEWVILIYSNMGFTYFSLFYMFLIVFLEKKPSLLSSSCCTAACLVFSESLPLLAHIWFQLEDGEQGVLYSERAYSSGKKEGRKYLYNSEKSFWLQSICICH